MALSGFFLDLEVPALSIEVEVARWSALLERTFMRQQLSEQVELVKLSLTVSLCSVL